MYTFLKTLSNLFIMKKLFLIVFLAAGLMFSGHAQTKKSGTAQSKSVPSKQVKKSDGTPDMRYKANKEAAKKKAQGHVKKDGTPDKRYKENRKKP